MSTTLGPLGAADLSADYCLCSNGIAVTFSTGSYSDEGLRHCALSQCGTACSVLHEGACGSTIPTCEAEGMM